MAGTSPGDVVGIGHVGATLARNKEIVKSEVHLPVTTSGRERSHRPGLACRERCRVKKLAYQTYGVLKMRVHCAREHPKNVERLACRCVPALCPEVGVREVVLVKTESLTDLGGDAINRCAAASSGRQSTVLVLIEFKGASVTDRTTPKPK